MKDPAFALPLGRHMVDYIICQLILVRRLLRCHHKRLLELAIILGFGLGHDRLQGRVCRGSAGSVSEDLHTVARRCRSAVGLLPRTAHEVERTVEHDKLGLELRWTLPRPTHGALGIVDGLEKDPQVVRRAGALPVRVVADACSPFGGVVLQLASIRCRRLAGGMLICLKQAGSDRLFQSQISVQTGQGDVAEVVRAVEVDDALVVLLDGVLERKRIELVGRHHPLHLGLQELQQHTHVHRIHYLPAK
mmetsp:Transcript_41841/g.104439  ORF Transcript_41841/g.104439 Transcript_41841/m.104439 type:complete len:248 (-) Transcript_41841:1589-2332(-)